MDNDEKIDKIKILEELKGSEDSIDKKKVVHTNGMTHMYWLPIGIALGSAIGASTNQLSLWLSLGIILGLLLSFLSRKN